VGKKTVMVNNFTNIYQQNKQSSFIPLGLIGRTHVQSPKNYYTYIFIYVLPLDIQLSRGEGWDLINLFNSATFILPVLSHELDSQRYMSWYFYVQ
jgi:hypothetical protein